MTICFTLLRTAKTVLSASVLKRILTLHINNFKPVSDRNLGIRPIAISFVSVTIAFYETE